MKKRIVNKIKSLYRNNFLFLVSVTTLILFISFIYIPWLTLIFTVSVILGFLISLIIRIVE
jgi:hypothetical protein